MKFHTRYHNSPKWYKPNQCENGHKCPSALNIRMYEGNVRTFNTLGFWLRSEEKSNIRTFMRHVQTFDASALWSRRAWTRAFEHLNVRPLYRLVQMFVDSHVRMYDVHNVVQFMHSYVIEVFPLFIHFPSCTKGEFQSNQKYIKSHI